MADVAGMVIGVIALASLYSTYIELFDISLRDRLHHWGGALKVEMPGDEDPALREYWPAEQNPIGRSLLGIKAILNDTSLLIKKSETPLFKQGSRVTSQSSLSLLRRRTLWAIHDKGKFDKIAQDLNLLVKNLEKVTGCLQMPSTPGLEESAHPAAGRHTSTETDLAKDTISCHQALSQARLLISNPPGEINQTVKRISVLAYPVPLNLMSSNEQPKDEQPNNERFEAIRAKVTEHFVLHADHVITSTQNNIKSATGFQGYIGPNGAEAKTLITAKQTNTDLSFGIQGVTDPQSLDYLREKDLARRTASQTISPPSSPESKKSSESSTPSKERD